MNNSKFKKLIITLFKILIVFALIIYMLFRPITYELKPSSPSNVKLISKTRSDLRGSDSKIYIKYPDSFKLVYSGCELGEDEGDAISSDDAAYSVIWIDDHHVKLTFKGRDYNKPVIRIIEY